MPGAGEMGGCRGTTDAGPAGGRPRRLSPEEPAEEPGESRVVVEGLQVGVAAGVVEVAIAEFQGRWSAAKAGSIIPRTA